MGIAVAARPGGQNYPQWLSDCGRGDMPPHRMLWRTQ